MRATLPASVFRTMRASPCCCSSWSHWTWWTSCRCCCCWAERSALTSNVFSVDWSWFIDVLIIILWQLTFVHIFYEFLENHQIFLNTSIGSWKKGKELLYLSKLLYLSTHRLLLSSRLWWRFLQYLDSNTSIELGYSSAYLAMWH